MIRNIYNGNGKLRWKELRTLCSKFRWQLCQILMKQHDKTNKPRISLGLVTYWGIQDKLLSFSSNSVSSSGKWRQEPCLCWSPLHLQFLLCKIVTKIKHINARMWNVRYVETKGAVVITSYINDNIFCSYRKKKWYQWFLNQGRTGQEKVTMCANLLREIKWRLISSLIDHLPHHLSHQILTNQTSLSENEQTEKYQ